MKKTTGFELLFIISLFSVVQYVVLVPFFDTNAFNDLNSYRYWYSFTERAQFIDVYNFHHDKTLTSIMYLFTQFRVSFNVFILGYSLLLIGLYFVAARQLMKWQFVIIFLSILLLSRLQIEFSMNTVRTELFSAFSVLMYSFFINSSVNRLRILLLPILAAVSFLTHAENFLLLVILIALYALVKLVRIDVHKLFYVSIALFCFVFIFNPAEFSIPIIHDSMNSVLGVFNHYTKIKAFDSYIQFSLFLQVVLYLIIPNVLLLKYYPYCHKVGVITFLNTAALMTMHFIPLALRLEAFVMPILFMLLIYTLTKNRKENVKWIILYVVFILLINIVLFIKNFNEFYGL